MHRWLGTSGTGDSPQSCGTHDHVTYVVLSSSLHPSSKLQSVLNQGEVGMKAIQRGRAGARSIGGGTVNVFLLLQGLSDERLLV